MNNEATKSLIWKATFTKSFCDCGNRDKAERAANAAVEYFTFTSLANQPKEAFVKPAGVTELTVCSFNGLPLRNQEATSSASKEYFISGLCVPGSSKY